LRPDGRVPQIATFRLTAGNNSVDLIEPYVGKYTVIVPNGAKTFYLSPGTKYRLAMWETRWLPSRVIFSL